MIGIGAAIGLLLSAALAVFLAKVMPAIATNRATAIAGSTVVLVTVALLACWLPARRAMKVNPTVALRTE